MSNSEIQVRWFFRLRICAFFMQILLIGASILYLPYAPVMNWAAALACLLPLTQIFAPVIRKIVSGESALLRSYLFFDTIQLSAVLWLTGGATNPFSLFFLVFVVLAAVMVDSKTTWWVAVLSTACFAALFIGSSDSSSHAHMMHDGGAYKAHLHGMFLSYVFVAGIVAYFLTRILSELRDKERRIQKLSANHDKLVSLTSQAASAAHELGTPLATIDLVAHELYQSIAGEHRKESISLSELIDDLQILRGEAQRCKGILKDICTQSGTVTAEVPGLITLAELRSIVDVMLAEHCHRVRWVVQSDRSQYLYPVRNLTSAIRSLVKNALDASTDGEAVHVSLRIVDGTIECIVKDSGRGIESELLSALGDPFVTTKADGMGLGVYTAQLVATQLGGELNFDSSPGEGTTVKFILPEIKQPLRDLVEAA